MLLLLLLHPWHKKSGKSSSPESREGILPAAKTRPPAAASRRPGNPRRGVAISWPRFIAPRREDERRGRRQQTMFCYSERIFVDFFEPPSSLVYINCMYYDSSCAAIAILHQQPKNTEFSLYQNVLLGGFSSVDVFYYMLFSLSYYKYTTHCSIQYKLIAYTTVL